jgi:gamma-butyrobetaine dioxygenase
MTPTIEEIFEVFRSRGQRTYGNGTMVVNHCVHTAELARKDGAHAALVAAALLHDIGHLIGTPPDGFRIYDHDTVAADYLAPVFPPQVTEPIRLHVRAKRYMISQSYEYVTSLSTTALKTLAYQGGGMTVDECAAFEDEPFCQDALRLRAWDDIAKVDGPPGPPLESYRDLLVSLAVGPQ